MAKCLDAGSYTVFRVKSTDDNKSIQSNAMTATRELMDVTRNACVCAFKTYCLFLRTSFEVSGRAAVS